MAAEIKYDIVGDTNFLRQAEYLFEIPNFLNEFETQFKLADEVFIKFEESLNPDPNKPVPNELVVSEDGKEIIIVYKTRRHNQPKGGLSKPSDVDFFKGLRFYLDNSVVKEDNERFDVLNVNLEEK